MIVWVGIISDNTIIGLYFFNGNVNGQSYVNVINTDTVPHLHARYGQGRNGAVPHLS